MDVFTYVRLPFCILGAATGSLIFLMGQSIFDRERGIIAAIMLTIEPFYIGITRIIHLDGLLAFFSTLTLYFFWLGITQQKQKYIILSGISLGLAALTKSPALLLIPVLAIWLWLLKNNDSELQSWQSKKLFIKIIAIGALTFFILWPGIGDFTTINQNLWYIGSKYKETIEGHENPIFFLGSLNNAAPIYFYPIMLVVRLSTGVLIFFIISIALYANKLRRRKIELAETLLVFVIVIFLIGFSIIGKKADRYLIPIWPIIMLTASGGFQTILNETRDFLNSIGRFRITQLLPQVILSFIVVFPAALWISNYQPFYVFYFNDFIGGLKGGSKITATYTSEGIRLAAEYLSNKSNGLVVACPYAYVILEYFYDGNVTALPNTTEMLYKQYDYVVFHLTWVQRWGTDNTIWLHFKDKSPEWTIIVQDVIILWIFKI